MGTLSTELKGTVPTVGGTYHLLSSVSGIHSEDYVHCDGTQLRLTNSYIGSEQYTISDYYMCGLVRQVVSCCLCSQQEST